MRREGSALQGLGVVTLKELSDHLSSARMRVLGMAGGADRARRRLRRDPADS